MAENEKKPIYKKWWFWLLAVIILGAIGSGASDSTKTTTSSTTGGQTATESSQPQEEQKADYKVGDTVKLKNHEIVVTKVNKNYSSGNQFDKPQSSDNVYVVADVTITNTGSGELAVNPFGFKLEDETGVQRDTTFGGIADGKLQSVTLSPNGKTTGKLVFEAKSGSSVLKLHYSPGVFGGDEVVINL